MTFYVGQKVVCVDASDHPEWVQWRLVGTLDGLKSGAVYIVRKIGKYRGHSAIWLNEITRKSDRFGEAGFSIKRFRPAVERKTETGMAILREILDRESHQDKPPVKRTVHS